MRYLGAISLAVATVALGGCVTGPEALVHTPSAPVDPERLVLTFVALPDSATSPKPGVEVLEGVSGGPPTEEGTLAFNDGGCVGLDLARGFAPVAFPDGSEVLPDGSGVRVPHLDTGESTEFTFGRRLEAAVGIFSANLAVNLSPACETLTLTSVHWE